MAGKPAIRNGSCVLAYPFRASAHSLLAMMIDPLGSPRGSSSTVAVAQQTLGRAKSYNFSFGAFVEIFK